MTEERGNQHTSVRKSVIRKDFLGTHRDVTNRYRINEKRRRNDRCTVEVLGECCRGIETYHPSYRVCCKENVQTQSRYTRDVQSFNYRHDHSSSPEDPRFSGSSKPPLNYVPVYGPEFQYCHS